LINLLHVYTLTAPLCYAMDFDIDFDDLFDNAVLCVALETMQDETGQGNLDRKKLWTTALLGSEYVNELLDSKHPDRIQQVLRMQLNTFYALRDWLLANT
jgi:hypothetical protein